MNTRKRLYLARGTARRRVIVAAVEVPTVGDVCTSKGLDWTVKKVESVDVSVEFKATGGKLRQVFP